MKDRMKTLQEIWKKMKDRVKSVRKRMSFQGKPFGRGWYKLSDNISSWPKRRRNIIAAYFALCLILIAAVVVGQNQRAERIRFEPLDSHVSGTDQEEDKETAVDKGSGQDSLSQGDLALGLEKEFSLPAGQAELLESFTWPVTGKMTAKFHQVYAHENQYRLHDGVDIEAPSGQEVKAALGGTVEKVETNPILGETVVLSHTAGIETIYGNLTKVQVLPGDQVEKGQVIAVIGDTARLDASQGYFLHFGVRVEGQYRDPQEYLP